MITYASVCDGIGAAHVAWQPLGWRCAWTSEIERFPIAVVDRRWGLPNLGDMTCITEQQLEQHGRIDLVVGGTPCQSFSVAGLRGGLGDPRGNLALRFLQLVGVTRTRWVVWENVPGVLSSNDGRDFGAILGGLVELGYGFAYRVLDAQYIRVDGHARAVPQRRRRVFVVGCARGWRRAAAVLLERGCLSGNPAPRRTAGQGSAGDVAKCLRGCSGGIDREDGHTHIADVSGSLTARSARNGGMANDDIDAGRLIAFGGNNTTGPIDVATACRAKGGSGHGDFESETFVAQTLRGSDVAATPGARHDSSPCVDRGPDVVVTPIDMRQASRGEKMTNNRREGSSGGAPGAGIGNPGDPSPSLSMSHPPAVAFQSSQSGVRIDDVHATLDSNNGSRRHSGAIVRMAVRRLTPRECERLQGFPDDYTLINYRGRPAKDGPRYKALGNSMACNVMTWIGKRIALVDQIGEEA